MPPDGVALLRVARLILLLAVHTDGATRGAYFTMPSVQLAVPAGAWPSRDAPLLRAAALALQARGDRGSLIYALSKPSPLFRLDPDTGQLFFRARAAEADLLQTAADELEVEVSAVSSTERRAEESTAAVSSSERMTIRVDAALPPYENTTYCEHLDEQVFCFWSNFSFNIMENRGPTKLGQFRPLFIQQQCPNYAVSYTIIKGSTDLFHVTQSPDAIWYLSTKKAFDREESDEWDLLVECTVRSMEGDVIRTQRNITVTILDEDDSPPYAQITSLDNYITNPMVEKGQNLDTGHLVVYDADSKKVNSYALEIMEDSNPPRLFDFSLRIWDFKLSQQASRANDSSNSLPTIPIGRNGTRVGFTHPPSTVVYIVVVFAKTMKLTNQVYSTTFSLKDVTLIGEKGRSKVTIRMRLTVGSTDPSSKFKGSAVPNKPENSKIYSGENKRLKFDISSAYPLFVTLPVSASNYARIAEPFDSTSSLQAIEARLYPKGSPFEVTPSSGIVYLRDSSLLQQDLVFVVSVQWGAEVELAKLTIKVIRNNTSCNKSSQDMSCANKKFQRTCESSCGLGSLGYCSWREPRNTFSPVDYLSSRYTTCSPNSTSCPNGVCDELEELDVSICPQDCSREVFGTARQHQSENKGRGIKSATGVCSCDTYAKCSCGPVGSEVKTTTFPANISNSLQARYPGAPFPHTLETTREGMGGGDDRGVIDSKAKFHRSHESCGESCLVAVALGVVAAFSIALAGAIYARKTRKIKRASHHLTSSLSTALAIPIHPHDSHTEAQAAASLGIQSHIYGHDDDDNLNPQQELPLLSMQQIHHEITPADTKWELSRQALQLEETLGEGEFGLVLKGKLKSPSGPESLVPYVTVAVKTLKEGAGELERAALASEFQLLKSIRHTNIVRLIGACTVPRDQSFLLIIEYAELGSLRNYLRKSRMSDSHGDIPLRRIPVASPHSDDMNSRCALLEPSSALLTSKHILSFAWQISKGMTYLSEIKLVHRDLAARNILLTEKGVCKISDFGLTRDIYEDDAYYKRSKGRVPVKWMAPESLSDHVYTTQSDVWGFGVLLWELVTLGSSPYPGVPLTELYSLLRAGYRMQKPQNCSSELYQIMLCCWQLDPGARPSFQCLMANLERMLQDEVEYLHLGQAAIALNFTYFNSPDTDDIRVPLSGDSKVQYSNVPQQIDEIIRDDATDNETADNSKSREEMNEAKQDASDTKSTDMSPDTPPPGFKEVNMNNEYTGGYELPINLPDRCD